ncbi:MAG: right-handed parallel beta-helix repeat-containing protein, partial [Anaerolineae bacterium]
ATIQYAIDQAVDGDTICVAKHILAGPLTYQETLVITKSVTLDGAWDAMCVDPNNLTCSFTAIPCDPANVTIDAIGCGRVISITGDISPTIHCFTITGGDAAGLGGDPGTMVDNDAGGGIYSRDAAPIIVHNIITGNYGCDTCPVSYGRGGGIYLLNAPSTAVISNNLIAYNVADESTWGQGGGIMLRDSDAQVLSNTIEHNRAGHSAGYGGGIVVREGSPIIADNVLAYNYAGQSVQGLGGGIFVWSTTPATIERNELRYNQALHGTGDPGLISAGGGIFYEGRTTPIMAIIRDNFLEWNLASIGGSLRGDGGGIYLRNLSDASIVSGNVLEWNQGTNSGEGRGGGIYIADSELTVENNELILNSASWAGTHGTGGAFYVEESAVVIQNNVITGNAGAHFGLPSTASGFGGGIAISGTQSIIQDNSIVGNQATNGDSLGVGGGIYSFRSSSHILGNTIAENQGSGWSGFDWGFGGGIYVEEGTTTMDANLILDNLASTGSHGRGGGVRLNNCPAFTLTNNIVARNDASELGSGIAVALSSGQIVHNTIAENATGDGVGVRVDFTGSDVTMTNNIIVSQTVGISNTNASNIVSADHTLFDGNGTDYGPDVTSSNEVAGPANLLPNYHLGPASNAIANALPLAWITHDVDGDSRPYRGAPDVGADEVSCLAHIVGGGGVYFTIQEAVNVASSGHTIRVAEGICYENVAITESLTLEGGWDQSFTTRSPNPASATTIDGLGRGRVIAIVETGGAIAPTVDGFTITGGDATGLGNEGSPSYDTGGGIYSYRADTTVTGCVVRGNVGSTSGIGWGGGVGAIYGNVTVENSTVDNNVASAVSNGYGGGLFFRYSTANVATNTIQSNVANAYGAGIGYGGGIQLFFNSAALRNNVIQGNTASQGATGYGGGLSLYGTNLVSLDGDLLTENAANVPNSAGYGGGISLRQSSEIEMDRVTLRDNVAYSDPPNFFGQGGGVYVEQSTVTMHDGQVIDNEAYSGGGVYLITSNNATLEGNHIEGNAAVTYGGGLFAQDSQSLDLSRNAFTGNEVSGNGGGAYLLFSGQSMLTDNTFRSNAPTGVTLYGCEEGQLDNNIIADNQTLGVLIVGHTTRMRHNTVARNGATGVGVGGYYAAFGNAVLSNTIIVSHTTGIEVSTGSTATLEATLWGAGAWANGSDTGGGGLIDTGTPAYNLWGHPHFLNPSGGNYHLGPGSAAADAAIPVGVSTDIDGDARPIGPAPDLGADESWLWSFLPLILRNG